MSEREERFEAMLQDIQHEYDRASARIDELKRANKMKGATFQQLLATKMSYQKMLALYRSYGLLDDSDMPRTQKEPL